MDITKGYEGTLWHNIRILFKKIIKMHMVTKFKQASGHLSICNSERTLFYCSTL